MASSVARGRALVESPCSTAADRNLHSASCQASGSASNLSTSAGASVQCGVRLCDAPGGPVWSRPAAVALSCAQALGNRMCRPHGKGRPADAGLPGHDQGLRARACTGQGSLSQRELGIAADQARRVGRQQAGHQLSAGLRARFGRRRVGAIGWAGWPGRGGQGAPGGDPAPGLLRVDTCRLHQSCYQLQMRQRVAFEGGGDAARGQDGPAGAGLAFQVSVGEPRPRFEPAQ